MLVLLASCLSLLVGTATPGQGGGRLGHGGGFENSTDEYLALDPIAVNATVKRATRRILYAYFDDDLGRAGVLV